MSVKVPVAQGTGNLAERIGKLIVRSAGLPIFVQSGAVRWGLGLTRVRPLHFFMSRLAQHEPTLSIRLLRPFARLISAKTNGMVLLSELNIGPAEFGDPDTRPPRQAVMRTPERAPSEYRAGRG